MSITAVIIVQNEAVRIGALLERLRFCGERIVVDGGSTDATVEIARRHGARVIVHPFTTFAEQRNVGLAAVTTETVLMIDADEWPDDRLLTAIKVLLYDGSSAGGFFVRRQTVIFGRRLRFGGCGQERCLRVFRSWPFRYAGAVHEYLEPIPARCETLPGTLHHASTATIGSWICKASRYIPLEVTELRRRGVVSRWYHVCVFPVVRFLRDYVWRLGFLDGYAGLLFHVLSAWYYGLKHLANREPYLIATGAETHDLSRAPGHRP